MKHVLLTGVKCSSCGWSMSWYNYKEGHIACENRACEEYRKPYEIPKIKVIPLDPKKQ